MNVGDKVELAYDLSLMPQDSLNPDGLYVSSLTQGVITAVTSMVTVGPLPPYGSRRDVPENGPDHQEAIERGYPISDPWNRNQVLLENSIKATVKDEKLRPIDS
ncbi:hypothetical protein ACFXO9_30740 [Nocardia tengchongensis]|uniref:hypothetical protein n=1 Tax=Nocardia tengchongensis TaxID=2055889 RepID=UPI0036CED508